MTKPLAYYNEFDPYAAAWLRNLIKENLIAPGDVDERSITDVQPDDLAGYTQCHFFAGIGGWSYALRGAGWPDDRPVWTGSCPCQPFSVAGKQAGFDDERHLWPQFKRLISQRQPTDVFGEQVAGASDWLRLVRGDLEEMGYAMGAVPLQAASAGADHFRDRYWFVAHSSVSCEGGRGLQGPEEGCGQDAVGSSSQLGRYRGCTLAHHHHRLGTQVQIGQPSNLGEEQPPTAGGDLRPVVNHPGLGWGKGWTEHEFRSRGFTAAVASISDCQYLECPDGKWRRLPPPGVRWLGNGIPARIPKLRAFGNAIDPRPASQFIKAYMTREEAI